MLEEKNTYSYDFPLSIKVGKLTEYPLHYHQDVELVFVLSGEIQLKNGYCDYLLKEGDVFSNNGKEVHGLYKTDKDNIVAILSFSNLYFTQFFPSLSHSCYRTYSPNPADEKFHTLNKILLHILLDYLGKPADYKSSCISGAKDLLAWLNEYFNLFSFDGRTVVNANYDSLSMSERISRIIGYVYEHYPSKITLKTVADMEHLSSYYISHIFTQYVGMNFRDFLCFARVESSEILLLATQLKISEIAKKVGFSTTSYYNKYFEQWFGLSPEDHRKKYLPMVKGPSRPPLFDPMEKSWAINLIRNKISYLESQTASKSYSKKRSLSITVGCENVATKTFFPPDAVFCPLESLMEHKYRILSILKDLGLQKLLVEMEPDKAPQSQLDDLSQLFKENGVVLSFRASSVKLRQSPSFGYDSIAGLIDLINQSLPDTGAVRPVKLLDDTSKALTLKGDSGLFTSELLPKPSFFGFLHLSQMRGELIAWGSQYSVIRGTGQVPTYYIIVTNQNNEIKRLCHSIANAHETQDILNSFNDELDLNITLNHIHGNYKIIKHHFTAKDTIFDLVAQNGFLRKLDDMHLASARYCSAPKTDFFSESAEGRLTLSFLLRGAEASFIIIQGEKETYLEAKAIERK